MSVFVNHEALARRKARLEKQAEGKTAKTNQNDLKAKYSGSNPEDLFKNPEFVKDTLRNIFK